MFEPILYEIPKPAVILEIAEGEPVTLLHSNDAFKAHSEHFSTVLMSDDTLHFCRQLLHQQPSLGTKLKYTPAANKQFLPYRVASIDFILLNEKVPARLLGIIETDCMPEMTSHFDQLINSSQDISFIINKAGDYLAISPKFSEILGYEAAEVLGTNLFSKIHPDDLHSITIAFRRLEKEKSSFSPLYRFQKKDGHWRWLQSVGTNLDESNPRSAVIVVSKDITQLVEAQTELELSIERYRLISKASNDALYDWDIEQDVFQWGEGFHRLFGYPLSTEPFRLATWAALTHPEDEVKHAQRWISLLQTPTAKTWTNEFRFRKADGTYAYVEEIGYLIRNQLGEPVRMIGSLQDVSEAKLASLRRQLEQSIVHFFRTGTVLKLILQQVVDYFAQLGPFELTEIWLCNSRQNKMQLSAFFMNPPTDSILYTQKDSVTEVKSGIGLPGRIWESGKSIHWETEDIHKYSVRLKAVYKAGIQFLSGLPLTDNDQFVGAIIVGSSQKHDEDRSRIMLFESIQQVLGAEIRRKQQEEEMHLMFVSSPDIIAIISQEGYFTKVNPAFCNLLGYSEVELTSRPFQSFVHPDDLTKSLETFNGTLIVGERAISYVNRYVTKSGESRWISWSSSDSFGEEQQAFAYGRDITEMKKLEQLIDSTSKLARIGSWEINLADKHIFCSQIVRSILGLQEKQQIFLNNKLEFIHPRSKETVRKLLQAAIFDKEPWDIEVEIRTRRGEPRWVRLIGQASFKNGRCDRIYGSMQDIHDEKLVQMQLEEANDRFERVSSATNDAIWDWDLRTNLLIWNDRFRKIFGYQTNPAGSSPKEWKNMVHPEDLHNLIKRITKSIEDPDSLYFDMEFRFQKSDTQYAYVSSKATLIRNAEGRALRIVGALSDITIRKNYEASLENLNQELKRINHELAGSNAELEQFAFVASHDLQEPLRMITGFLTMLEKKYGPQLDAKANQYIYYAVDGAKRMRGIILDLLEYSRVGRTNTTPELVNTESLVMDVQQMLQNQIQEKNVQIRTSILPTLISYKIPLLQLFQNLISNAIKYSHPERRPEIDIFCRERELEWEFIVEDNGIGIEQAYREKVFVIFHRLNYTPDIPGSGMGLAIAKKIVDWQGGTIWVDSTPGTGSKFHFTLPKLNKEQLAKNLSKK